MAKQDANHNRSNMQNRILDLEKKYFSVIEKVIKSQSFIDDLLLIEKEIRENYPKFKETWNLKNKLKVPAERVIRHHIYLALSDEIQGIYPSPISSDLGIRLEDCVLCIDSKTIDTDNNAGDIRATEVEPNQISFDNSNHKYVKSVSNLESIDHYSRLPVLTYIIKIIYTDDHYSFKLARGNNPSMVLACIPNGELSSLFNKDIIQNFKTYDYYSDRDNGALAVHEIPAQYSTKESKDDYTELYCSKRGFAKIEIPLDRGTKTAYYDPQNKCIWWQTTTSKKPTISAVKSGSSTRVSNEILSERFDSKDNMWNGYKEFTLPDPLP